MRRVVARVDSLERVARDIRFRSLRGVREMNGEPHPRDRSHRSERMLATIAPRPRVVLVSHVNPDPDALASMLGLQTLLAHCQPEKKVVMTVDGMIARAENRVMVESIPIPLEPVGSVPIAPGTAGVMVDTQPNTGRRSGEDARQHVVLDHHETGGILTGVLFRDIRAHVGATSTIVTGYLLEQNVPVSP